LDLDHDHNSAYLRIEIITRPVIGWAVVTTYRHVLTDEICCQVNEDGKTPRGAAVTALAHILALEAAQNPVSRPLTG